MAMIMCPECRHFVSDKAAACPRCGYPVAASVDSASLAPSTSAPASSVPKKQTQVSVSTMVTVLSIAVFLILVFALDYGMKNGTISFGADEVPVSTETDNVQSSRAVENWQPKRLSIEDMAIAVKAKLKDAYDNYEVSTDGNTITVNVWYDGVAYGVLSAKAGDAASVAVWDEVKKASSGFTSDMLSTIRGMGPEDAHLVYNVLNDQNRSNVLLSLLDGVVVLDAVAK